jgi:hypothetical protein
MEGRPIGRQDFVSANEVFEQFAFAFAEIAETGFDRSSEIARHRRLPRGRSLAR